MGRTRSNAAVVQGQVGAGGHAFAHIHFAAVCNHAFRCFHRFDAGAFQCEAHVFYPNRYGDCTTVTCTTHAARFVKADIDGSHNARVEADKPCVFVVVGGTGFTGDVGAAECGCTACGTDTDNVLHDFVHDVGVARVNGLRCVFTGY